MLRMASAASASAAAAAAAVASTVPAGLSLFDIGANLLDGMFKAGDLRDARRALALARKHNATTVHDEKGGNAVRLYTTVGVHPTNTKQLDAPVASDAAAEGSGGHTDTDEDEHAASHSHKHRMSKTEYIAAMEEVIRSGLADGTVVAIGECGLDYDRLFFSPKETQLAHFELHFALAEKYGLPLFLHDRNTDGNFAEIIKRNRHRFSDGVVHSFTGTAEELAGYLELGLYIGINGCSLKTEENCAVAAQVPLDRLMLETDAPWCEIKRTHASHKHVKTHFPSVKKEKHDPTKLVNSRSEPCQMIQVAEAVAGIKGVALETVIGAATDNARRVFLSRRKV